MFGKRDLLFFAQPFFSITSAKILPVLEQAEIIAKDWAESN